MPLLLLLHCQTRNLIEEWQLDQGNCRMKLNQARIDVESVANVLLLTGYTYSRFYYHISLMHVPLPKEIMNFSLSHRSEIVVMGQTPFYWTSNELKHHFLNIERVHLLIIKLEHLNFAFKWTDNVHRTQMAFTRFTKSFIEQTRTLNGLEPVHL